MNRQKNKDQIALNGIEIPAAVMGFDAQNNNDGRPLPAWVELIPAGRVQGRDGRGWENSDPAAIIARFLNSGVDLPVDLEHATELKAPKGEPAPAAGWIKELESRGGSVWGRVEWNAVGQDLVGTKQYRYLSPVILYNKESGEIAGLTSVGLTNRPNLNLQALNQEQGGSSPMTGPDPKEIQMDWKKILAAMGLAETATEAEALNAIQKLKADLASAANRVENPSLEKFVPRADYEIALNRAVKAEQDMADQKNEELETAINSEVAAAVINRKISPGTADFYKSACHDAGGLERFRAFVKLAPDLLPDSGLDNRNADTTGKDRKALNAEEQKVCDNLGITADEYLKTPA